MAGYSKTSGSRDPPVWLLQERFSLGVVLPDLYARLLSSSWTCEALAFDSKLLRSNSVWSRVLLTQHPLVDVGKSRWVWWST